MRFAPNQAWKGPRVAVKAAAHASEVEAVAPLGEFGRALWIDCDVGLQCAPYGLLACTEHGAADAAARSVGSDQHLRIKNAVLRVDAHAVSALCHVEHAVALDDFDAGVGRGAREHRVEAVAAND